MDFRALELFARACAWLVETVGLQSVGGIRREALARQWCFEAELFGEHLRYALWLDGGWVNLRCEGLDQVDASAKPLLTIAAGAKGFEVVCRLIAELERSGVKRIELPLQLGQEGMVDSWLIS